MRNHRCTSPWLQQVPDSDEAEADDRKRNAAARNILEPQTQGSHQNLDLQTAPKREPIYSLCWDQGHSFGYLENKDSRTIRPDASRDNSSGPTKQEILLRGTYII